MTIQKEILELVRDLTSMANFPMSKSEVRQRIDRVYEAGQMDYAKKLHLATIPPGINVSDFGNVQEVVGAIKQIGYEAGKEEELFRERQNFDHIITEAEQRGYQNALDELIKEWPEEWTPIKALTNGDPRCEGYNETNRTGLDLIKSKHESNN